MTDGIAAVLRECREVAAGTVEMTFAPAQEIPFRAGQYCRVDLAPLRWPDRKSSRKFSMVNAPSQTDRIVIATRSGESGYKRSLESLEVGAHIRITRIKGDLVLPSRRRRPLSFIAGGIGIVPFVSMLRELQHRKELQDVALVYFNRNRASSAYLDELTHLADQNAGFTFLPVMTREPEWQGERRRLTKETLPRLRSEPRNYDHYVVGTPHMVSSTVRALSAAGVKRRRIHEEDFSGYRS